MLVTATRPEMCARCTTARFFLARAIRLTLLQNGSKYSSNSGGGCVFHIRTRRAAMKVECTIKHPIAMDKRADS